MRKGDETLSVGQDVYLENDLQIPYVARLQEIFTYTFAPKEVYFNARWYYREADVHEYAKLQGAKADVNWEGDRLTAMPPELFFSLHNDENHTDCILRACVVHLIADHPEGSMWGQLKRHEYMAWRAYDAKNVYGLSELPTKKLRDAYMLERKRSVGSKLAPPKPQRKEPKRSLTLADGPLSRDELRAVWMPRKHLEVYMETDKFVKVVTGTLVRVSTMVNGQRTFSVAYCIGMKKAPTPYRHGKKVLELALQVRTHMGVRMTGIDTLSNLPPTDAELDALRLPLDSVEVRYLALPPTLTKCATFALTPTPTLTPGPQEDRQAAERDAGVWRAIQPGGAAYAGRGGQGAGECSGPGLALRGGGGRGARA